MAFNAIESGGTIQYVNGGTVRAPGDVIIQERLILVAAEAIAASATGTCYTDGVFELPKASGAVIAQGENVIWDVSAGTFDDDLATPASGDISKGAFAIEAAGNGVTTVKVRLMPGSGTTT
jgi:predicted RecA/RadA family phage recombinase